MPTPTSRKGEEPYEFISDVLGLTDVEFEHAQRDPVMLGMLGRLALDCIANAKELELEKARAQAYKERALNAETDEVTGLLTRQAFLEVVRDLRPADAYLAVMMDIRGLKAINDGMNHQAGDLLLAGAARTLVQKGVRTGSVLGRWGGDEFAMAIPVDEQSDPEAIMRRLGELFRGDEAAELCDIGEGKGVYLSARFGYCAVKDMSSLSIEAALAQADELMQIAGMREKTRGVMPELIEV